MVRARFGRARTDPPLALAAEPLPVSDGQARFWRTAARTPPATVGRRGVIPLGGIPLSLSLLPPSEDTTPGVGLYADVAVDVRGRGPDQLFTYAVPPSLAEAVVPGRRVRVPFGREEAASGVVFELKAESDVPPAKVRMLLAALDQEPALRPVDLECARWLAQRTVCTLAQAVRAFLPPDVAAERTEVGYHPVQAVQDTSALLRRAPAQASAWREIVSRPGSTGAELARRGVRPSAVAALVRRGLVEGRPRQIRRDPFAGVAAPAPETPPSPTPAQAAALEALASALDTPTPGAYLLWGVTGSGKTEVYLRAIERVLAAGRQALVLVPEIALTPQTVSSFRRRFGVRVAVLHSALGLRERHDQWWRIRRGEVDVAVGARSAVFAPFPRLGLIVVDEEHEPSYKQEEAPRYHTREVALWRGRRHGFPVVLGSATPDLETFQAASDGRVLRLDLPARVASRALPPVRCIDLRQQVQAELLAPELVDALRRHLSAGRQALLFLNRRGFAPVVLCSACGYTSRCQSCSVTLCYHESDRMLHCHYCGVRREPPTTCPRCGGHFLRLRGSGTERVVQEVVRLFPSARVLRMDLDTTGTRGAHHRIYEEFRAGRADVLVGTQMVAKGWDVAGVTLVGVVDADTALHLPDYRGAERTFQLLCQVAGRAGRGAEPGEVLVQTRTPEHYAVVAAAGHDYAAFAAQELSLRRATGFPPFSRLLRVLCWSVRASEAERAARLVAGALAPLLPPGVDLWGPGQAPLARLRGWHRWHLALRGKDGAVLRDVVRAALSQTAGHLGDARVAADPDPLTML